MRPLALGVRLANMWDASPLPTPAPATPAVGTRAAAERGARPWDPPCAPPLRQVALRAFFLQCDSVLVTETSSLLLFPRAL